MTFSFHFKLGPTSRGWKWGQRVDRASGAFLPTQAPGTVCSAGLQCAGPRQRVMHTEAGPLQQSSLALSDCSEHRSRVHKSGCQLLFYTTRRAARELVGIPQASVLMLKPPENSRIPGVGRGDGWEQMHRHPISFPWGSPSPPTRLLGCQVPVVATKLCQRVWGVCSEWLLLQNLQSCWGGVCWGQTMGRGGAWVWGKEKGTRWGTGEGAQWKHQAAAGRGGGAGAGESLKA